MTKVSSSALVVFSGGQDSATCLAWALDRFQRVETIGFFYGQRHAVELDVRGPFLGELRTKFPVWAGRLGSDRVVDLSVLGQVSKSALTADIQFGTRDDGLPSTFVPGRNLVFMTFAAAVAFQRDLKHLVTGVCETDFSGYPDCRDDTMKALQIALNLGMQSRLVIDTPLMWINKSDTWALADRLGGHELVNLIKELTHTCYNGDRSHKHPWGYGCGSCDACRLRATGWEQFLEPTH
jgi:7-cyano-7-deazaguanine synthase